MKLQFRLRWLFVAVAVVAVGLAIYKAVEPQRELETVESILSTEPGWEVALPPDRPGPYYVVGGLYAGSLGEPMSTVTTVNGDTRRFYVPAKENTQYMDFQLETLEGEATALILQRTADPDRQ